MTLELTISQNQTAISESCNNVAEIQANIQFLNIIKGKKGDKGDTPYIGLNGNWWVSGEDTGTPATGDDGVGISNWELVSTVGKVKTYRITFSNSTTFEYTLEDGNDGREVIIQNNGTYIQWQYEGDEAWNNIVEVSTLKGDTGSNIELQKSATHIQWRVVGDTNWIDLIALADLKGNDGRGIVSIIKTSTVGLVDTYTITYSDSTTSTFDVTNGEKGDDGTSAYQIYLAGGGTLSEVDFNAAITDIPAHIEDATKHIDTATAEFSGTIDETNDKFTIWDNSLLKWIRFSFTSLKTYLNGIYHKFDGSSFGAKQIIGSTDNQDFGIITDNTERITVLKNGNVGIGKPNPTYKLDVNGDLRIAYGNKLYLKTPCATSYIEGSLGDFFNFYGYWGQNFLDNTGTSMSIRSGNVGIGTTTPKSKLQVVGGIQCGDDTAAASADKKGTTRYRATANASYVEMCMQVGASSYSWVAIVTNTW